MAMTAAHQKALGDHAIGKTAWTMPAGVHLGLFTASPGENGSLVSEISGGSYARRALTASMAAADTVTGIATNTSAITFAAPTAAWGLNLYGGILDSATLGAGNVLFYAPWANPNVINNGDPAVVIPAGSITVNIAGTTLAMISSYLMKKLVDKSLAKADWAMPAGVYHGLLASDPTVAGTLTSEVGVGAYTRQALTAAMSTFDALTGIATNANAIAYPTPTADYPSVNYSFVADAAAAGNVLFSNQLPSPLAIRNARAPALFPAGSISLTFA